MEYTVQGLAKLAGVSARTLRYYDQIGLLRPERISGSGYRIYGQKQVDILQQILFYREMNIPLDQIAQLLNAESFNRLDSLREHERNVLAKLEQMEKLLQNVRLSIAAEERGMKMADQEKFIGLKNVSIEENEQRYGEEIRSKYGEQTINKSNQKIMGMSEETYLQMKETEAEILRLLDAAFETGDPASEPGMALAKAHKAWLSYTWQAYSPQAHAGLVRMYAEDPRFAEYYDRGIAGKTEFLCNCVLSWLSAEK